MNRRIPLVAGTAGGGLLLAAFLQAAVAAAETEGGAGASDAAFTVDGITLDPGSDGYDEISPLFSNAPLLGIGGGSMDAPIIGDTDLAEQSFTAYDGTGSDANELGTVDTAVNAANLFGMDSAEFTVTGSDPYVDIDAGDIESVLADSDLDFGDSDIDAGNIADALADSDINFGDAGDFDFNGKDNSLGDALDDAGIDVDDDGNVADTDFTTDDLTDVMNSDPFVDVVDDNTADLPIDDGTVYSITNLTSGLDSSFLGGDIYNVYEAVPGDDGGDAAITDTLVTPWGNIDLPTDFDATAQYDPTETFAGLDDPASGGGFGDLLGGSDGGSDGPLDGLLGGEDGALPFADDEDDSGDGGEGSGGDGASDNAFTLGGVTYDPGSDGWTPMDPLFSDSPLMQIAGGNSLSLSGIDVDLSDQSFDVYGDDDSDGPVGSVDTHVSGSNILGIEATQFNVDTVHADASGIESALGDSEDISFGDDISTGDVADTLADNLDVGNGDVSADDVTGALAGADFAGDLGIDSDGDFDADNVAEGVNFDPSDVASALNDNLDTADLPATGTVNSVTDLGGGFMNVYEAVPGDGEDASTSISDTLVTPFGNFDIPTDFDATADLQPGDATDGLDTGSGGGGLFDDLGGLLGGSGGDDSDGPIGGLLGDDGPLSMADADDGSGGDEGGLSDHAFTIGDSTFDPGSDGWDSISPLSGVAPLMEIGGAHIDPIPVLGGSDDLATQDLDVYDGSGDDASQIGSVETAVNTSNILGIETTQFTVTGVDADVDADQIESALGDSGNISFGDDIAGGDVADTLADNLDFGSGDISADDVTDALAGADFAGDLGISTDDDGASFDADNVADGVNFDPSDVASALNDNLDTAALPADGSVYSVSDLGLGIHNVYEAVPADGDGDPTITDTLVTPLGNFDLSTPFNALADLDPGDAAGGANDSGDDLFGGLFGDLGGLLGGSGDADAPVTDASEADIASALSSADIGGDDFTGDDSALSDVASALAGGDGTDVLGGDVSGDDISGVLSGADISIGDDTSADAIADALNSAGGDSGSGGLFDGLFDDLGDLFGGGEDGGGDEAGGLFGDLGSSIFG
jgi:hypothetical protein